MERTAQYTLVIMITLSALLKGTTLFSQDWDKMSDSAYYHIVENRFSKGNIIVGLGGTIKTEYEALSFVGVGARAKAGYFIADRWMISADMDYYYAWVKQTRDEHKSTYYRFLFGLNTRHYFKPKHRTFFLDFGPLAGYEHLTDSIGGTEKYKRFIYGGRIGIGVSVYVRNIEFELIAGIQVFGSDYSTNNLYNNMWQLLQINLSYLFDRNRKISIKN